MNYICNVVPGGAGCGGPAISVEAWPPMSGYFFFCLGVSCLVWCALQIYDRWPVKLPDDELDKRPITPPTND